MVGNSQRDFVPLIVILRALVGFHEQSGLLNCGRCDGRYCGGGGGGCCRYWFFHGLELDRSG